MKLINLNRKGVGVDLRGVCRFGATEGPLDGLLLDIHTDATAAYSLRKLRKNCTTALRVRRSSDDAEQDIGFVENSLDTTALLTFCGDGDGFVKTWYDQTGNGNNSTQSTTGVEPQIVAEGVIIVDEFNNLPTIDFRTNKWLGGLNLTVKSAFTVINTKISDATRPLLSGPSMRLGIGHSSFQYFTTVFAFPELRETVLGTVIADDSLSVSAYRNSVQSNDNPKAASLLSGVDEIGRIGEAVFLNQLVQELIVFDSDQTANRAAIEADINNHYSLFFLNDGGVSKTFEITGTETEEEKILLLSLHKRPVSIFEDVFDIYFNNKCNDDFSDVRILDEGDNAIPFDVIAGGNYDIISDNANYKGIVRTLSDGRLVSNLGISSDNGVTWTPFVMTGGFVSIADSIFAEESRIVYRSVSPYTVKTPVLDFTDVTGSLPQWGGIAQLSTGEIFLGRYQTAFDVKIYKSVDDGQTWELVFESTDFQHVHNIQVDESQTPAVVYAGIDGGGFPIYKSTDKGDTWNRLLNVKKASDGGVIYSDPSGYRLIGGETTIVGGYSIQKTTDDINFTPVLAINKGIYFVKKLNGNLYAGAVATDDSQSVQILRSTDEGDTWETVFITQPHEENGASDGYRWMSDVINSQLFVGMQSNTHRTNLRIVDGGINRYQQIMCKLTVPTAGRTIKVQSGFSTPSQSANIAINTVFEESILKLPFNTGSGDGLRRLYEFHPAKIHTGYESSFNFNTDTYTPAPLSLDLSAGNWSILFWTAVDFQIAEGVVKDEIILCFNPGETNAQYLTLRSGALLKQNATVLGYTGRGANYARLIVITCDSEGVLTYHRNGGGIRSTDVFPGFDKSQLSGTCYLFASPVALPADTVNYRHSVQDFEIVNRVLTASEISKMYGGKFTNLKW